MTMLLPRLVEFGLTLSLTAAVMKGKLAHSPVRSSKDSGDSSKCSSSISRSVSLLGLDRIAVKGGSNGGAKQG